MQIDAQEGTQCTSVSRAFYRIVLEAILALNGDAGGASVRCDPSGVEPIMDRLTCSWAQSSRASGPSTDDQNDSKAPSPALSRTSLSFRQQADLESSAEVDKVLAPGTGIRLPVASSPSTTGDKKAIRGHFLFSKPTRTRVADSPSGSKGQRINRRCCGAGV
jgi:hypothetical protein